MCSYIHSMSIWMSFSCTRSPCGDIIVTAACLLVLLHTKGNHTSSVEHNTATNRYTFIAYRGHIRSTCVFAPKSYALKNHPRRAIAELRWSNLVRTVSGGHLTIAFSSLPASNAVCATHSPPIAPKARAERASAYGQIAKRRMHTGC